MYGRKEPGSTTTALVDGSKWPFPVREDDDCSGGDDGSNGSYRRFRCLRMKHD
jgi:hypothetical protein